MQDQNHNLEGIAKEARTFYWNVQSFICIPYKFEDSVKFLQKLFWEFDWRYIDPVN